MKVSPKHQASIHGSSMETFQKHHGRTTKADRSTMGTPRKHHESTYTAVILPWNCHGASMVFPWCLHCGVCACMDFSVILWCFDGAFTGLPWCFHGTAMEVRGLLWIPAYNSSMMLSRCFHGYFYGAFIVLPWWRMRGQPSRFHVSTVQPFFSHGASMVLPWDVHGTSTRLS